MMPLKNHSVKGSLKNHFFLPFYNLKVFWMLKVEPFRQKGSSMVQWHREAGMGGDDNFSKLFKSSK